MTSVPAVYVTVNYQLAAKVQFLLQVVSVGELHIIPAIAMAVFILHPLLCRHAAMDLYRLLAVIVAVTILLIRAIVVLVRGKVLHAAVVEV